MSADSGSVTLVIQHGESGLQSLANATEVVHKGRGRIAISKDILVPDTKADRCQYHVRESSDQG